MAVYRADKQSVLIKPIETEVLPPKTNPLDDGVRLQAANRNNLATDTTTEDLTTPEASLSHTELEPEEGDIAAELGLEDDNSTSQSTLSGSTFHTTQLAAGDYADSDESQRWQIISTARGTGTLER